jgi:hypothetical protein
MEIVGQICFSFGWNGDFVVSAGSDRWLGEPNVVLPDIYLEGWIYPDEDPGIPKFTKITTREEDEEWAKSMSERLYTTDVYSMKYHCRKFSQDSFERAPGQLQKEDQ